MTQTEALKALVHEMEYVLSCINAQKVPFDGDDFHEALRLGKEALSQTENDKERCVGCEACIDTACGRDECPKGWPKAAQPEQEPVAWISKGGLTELIHSVYTEVYAEQDAECLNTIPLYTTPPQRKPLTVAEVEQILSQHDYEIHGDRARYIVRMTEAAHGIKE